MAGSRWIGSNKIAFLPAAHLRLPGPRQDWAIWIPVRIPRDGDRADVLTMYTPQARDAAGGVPQIEALIQAAVDNANTAFMNSEMPLRFHLAGTALADHDDAGNSGTDLSWLINDAVTAALRDDLNADLVSLITEDGAGFCGRGQLPLTWGPGGNPGAVHQVTARGCAVGNLTYAHEHGHNMGLEHDPANANPPGSGTYPYRYGHFVSGSYRTVMSYSNQCSGGCPRVTQWSNPDVIFLGQPTGITDERDNRRASGLTDGCVVDYRIGGLFADGFESRRHLGLVQHRALAVVFHSVVQAEGFEAVDDAVRDWLLGRSFDPASTLRVRWLPHSQARLP